MIRIAVEKFNEYKEIFTPNYQKIHVKNTTLARRVLAAWVNASQFIISIHCVSNRQLGLSPRSLAYFDGDLKRGADTTSFGGRIVHLGSLTALIAAIAKGTWPVRYGMIALSVALVATKLVSNYHFSFSENIDFGMLWVKTIFDLIPNGNLVDDEGRVSIFEYLNDIGRYNAGNNVSLELWHNLLKTADVNQEFEGRTLLTRTMPDDYYEALLQHKPNVRHKIYIEDAMREYLPLEWAIFNKKESVVKLLLEHNNAKDYSEIELKGMLRSENSDNVNQLLRDAIAKKRSNFRLNYTHTDFSSLREASIVKKALYCWVNFSQFFISNSALSNKLLSMYSYRRFITSESSFTVNTVPPVWKRLAHATSVYAVGCLFLLQNNGWVKTVTAGTLAAMAFTKLISNRIFLNDTVEPLMNFEEVNKIDPDAVPFSETVTNPNM